MDPTLSVVIVMYNSADVLGDCLRSIRDDVASGWAEAILVDNASPDDSVEVGHRSLPAATHVALDENLGFAGGANAGIVAATARYIMLLNPDVRVPEGGLRQLVAWMDTYSGIAAASPRLIGGDGADVFAGRALPSIWRSLLELTRLHKLLPPELRGRALQGAYWTGGDQMHAGWVPGTAMIVRSSTVAMAGPLSEEFFMYGEDIEWCHRIARTAGRIGVCSTVSVVHDWGSSSRRSWGEVEAERRVTAGIAAACAVMYGQAHARALVAVNAVAALLEAWMPGRSAEHRRVALAQARNWRRCLSVRAPARREARPQSAAERVQ